METSEQLPRGAVQAPSELVRRSGPFLSVYLNTEDGTGAGIREVDDADRLAEGVGALLRWTTG